MKPISQMTLLEVAAFVHDQLRKQGIDVVLSGGSVVSLYSQNLYVYSFFCSNIATSISLSQTHSSLVYF
ncbi:MAG: hypothetical protein WCK35_00780 [Chloroflexota bacterium]